MRKRRSLVEESVIRIHDGVTPVKKAVFQHVTNDTPRRCSTRGTRSALHNKREYALVNFDYSLITCLPHTWTGLPRQAADEHFPRKERRFHQARHPCAGRRRKRKRTRGDCRQRVTSGILLYFRDPLRSLPSSAAGVTTHQPTIEQHPCLFLPREQPIARTQRELCVFSLDRHLLSFLPTRARVSPMDPPPIGPVRRSSSFVTPGYNRSSLNSCHPNERFARFISRILYGARSSTYAEGLIARDISRTLRITRN